MSSGKTHMVLGAVAGTVLVEVGQRAGLTAQQFITMGAVPPAVITGVQSVGLDLVCAGASAILALLPDIDEPKSIISQHTRMVISGIGVLIGGWVGWVLIGGILPAIIGILVGAVLGQQAGQLIVKGIRVAAGGHRRLTHSFVLAGVVLVGGVGLVLWGASIGWLGIALAWGIVAHNLGDLVTPAGVPLWYPFSSWDYHILPPGIRRAGEQIALVTALLVGVAVRVYGLP